MSGVDEVLAAHLPQGGLGWTRDQDGCSCGTVLPTYADYLAHVAEQLQPLIRQAQAEAWDAGYVAGGCDSRIVEGDPERNPYLAGDA